MYASKANVKLSLKAKIQLISGISFRNSRPFLLFSPDFSQRLFATMTLLPGYDKVLKFLALKFLSVKLSFENQNSIDVWHFFPKFSSSAIFSRFQPTVAYNDDIVSWIR